jgi:hypothetical protein
MTTDTKKDEIFIIFKLNDPDFTFHYAACRVQKRNEHTATKNLANAHPDCEVLLRLDKQQVILINFSD